MLRLLKLDLTSGFVASYTVVSLAKHHLGLSKLTNWVAFGLIATAHLQAIDPFGLIDDVLDLIPLRTGP